MVWPTGWKGVGIGENGKFVSWHGQGGGPQSHIEFGTHVGLLPNYLRAMAYLQLRR